MEDRQDGCDDGMSAAVYWPPVSQEEFDRRVEEASRRELKWLIETVLPSPLQATQDGLTECVALLDPREDGSKLPLSSTRSETLKGFVERMGERIVRGELLIKMFGLGGLRKGCNVSIANQGIVLQQVVDAKNHIGEALSLFEQKLDEKNALQILTTLLAHIAAARACLRIAPPSLLFPIHIPSPTSFETPLPPNVSFDLTINEGLLQLDIRILRTITPKSTPTRTQSHTSLLSLAKDSATKLNLFKRPEYGRESYKYDEKEVIVTEQVRVSSADPNFIAVLAKLAVLEEKVNNLRGKVEVISLGVQKTY